MKAGAVALAIALFAACSGGDEPRNSSTDAGTGTSQTETKVAARTPAPMPTRPKRIDHLLTPTALPGATKEKTAKTAGPEAKRTNGEPTSNGAANAVTGGPMTIAELVTEDPRTNDRVLLQNIYAEIDLEQFALDPDQPIPTSETTIMPHPMIHQHPYLHLFPELEMMTRKRPGESNYSPGDIHYSPYGSYGYHYGTQPIGDRFADISGTRNGLIYFIYNPWFEPVFPGSGRRTTNTSGFSFSTVWYERKGIGAGPYWFGNNSVRGVLAETVAELLEEAKLPSTEPAQAPWFRKEPGGRTDLETPEMQKLTIEEFISTTISFDEEKGLFYCRDKYGKCKMMRESRITPWVEWEILHPQLPILKITAHAEQRLPLEPAGLEKIPKDDTFKKV